MAETIKHAFANGTALHSMQHFLKLARRGRPRTGASTGEVQARELALAILDLVLGLDAEAIEGAAEFLRRVSAQRQAARDLVNWTQTKEPRRAARRPAHVLSTEGGAS